MPQICTLTLALPAAASRCYPPHQQQCCYSQEGCCYCACGPTQGCSLHNHTGQQRHVRVSITFVDTIDLKPDVGVHVATVGINWHPSCHVYNALYKKDPCIGPRNQTQHRPLRMCTSRELGTARAVVTQYCKCAAYLTIKGPVPSAVCFWKGMASALRPAATAIYESWSRLMDIQGSVFVPNNHQLACKHLMELLCQTKLIRKHSCCGSGSHVPSSKCAIPKPSYMSVTGLPPACCRALSSCARACTALPRIIRMHAHASQKSKNPLQGTAQNRIA